MDNPRPNVPLDPALAMFPEFNIDSANLEELRFIVYSQAWRGFFEPLLRNLETQLVNEILTPPEARNSSRTDGDIRGAVYVIRNMLNLPAQALQEADAEAEEERKRQDESRLLALRANHGFYNPYGPTPGS